MRASRFLGTIRDVVMAKPEEKTLNRRDEKVTPLDFGCALELALSSQNLEVMSAIETSCQQNDDKKA